MARVHGMPEAGWKVAVYIRLSKEDGNDESLSVGNQKKIALDYLEHSFEGVCRTVDFYTDDGLTGTDYDRPGFQRMLRGIEAGKIDCVVCKNLSRAFRNYADQGYFLENYFPRHGTRFITIGDPRVDSYLHPETIQNLEVPITGLMNDRFACRTSGDIRATFDTKRRNGEFIGAFAPYGYQKDPNNKNALVPDEEAARVVRRIFLWFAYAGMSKNGIARKLNEWAVPNPTEYKRRSGMKYHNPSGAGNDGLWSAGTVARILSNPVYLGHMVQGRQKVVSYKVHDKVPVPREKWFVKENTHAPVVDAETFERAQSLQQQNTRTAPSCGRLSLFSGFLRCSGCGKALSRKRAKNHVYYFCRTYREKSRTRCTRHSIREEDLRAAVLLAIQKQEELVRPFPADIRTPRPSGGWDGGRLLALRRQAWKRVAAQIDSLYPDWKNGDLTRQEYHRLKEKLTKQAAALEQAVASLEQETEEEKEEKDADSGATAGARGILRLERGILAQLVSRIDVGEGGITIRFRFADPYQKSPG
ncbi:protein of unknown function [Ruminococcaceae bacterium BL-6]|nr:protein of unknown function [Ruminococcaceae bacterium BL-6]